MTAFQKVWRILKYIYASAIIIAMLYILYDIFITGTDRNFTPETVFEAYEVIAYTSQMLVYDDYHAYTHDIYDDNKSEDESLYPIIHYIPWIFAAYGNPDFTSEILQDFDTGYVTITKHCPDNEGWALVSTSGGKYWVYLNSNRRFIRRKMGLFENKGDTEPTAYLASQLINVLDISEDWMLVDTEYGEKWLYLDFWPGTRQLSAFLAPFNNNLSVYFRNMETGFSFVFNTGRRYFSASTAKAPFALYLYKKAERGEINLSDYITYTYSDFLWGSGVIRYFRVGTEITQLELLRKNIMYSDNIATLMLRRVHGLDGYRDFVASLGANPNNVHDNVFNSFLNIEEAGIFIGAIFDYIESGGVYSEYFRRSLLNNKYPSLTSDYPIAGKSGWTYPSAWHEMAIIYAPSPFVLAILSINRRGAQEDFQLFGSISMMFQEFNNTWFTPANINLP